MSSSKSVDRGIHQRSARRLEVEHLGKSLKEMETTLHRLVRPPTPSSWICTDLIRLIEQEVSTSRLRRRRGIRDVHARLSHLSPTHQSVRPLPYPADSN